MPFNTSTPSSKRRAGILHRRADRMLAHFTHPFALTDCLAGRRRCAPDSGFGCDGKALARDACNGVWPPRALCGWPVVQSLTHGGTPLRLDRHVAVLASRIAGPDSDGKPRKCTQVRKFAIPPHCGIHHRFEPQGCQQQAFGQRRNGYRDGRFPARRDAVDIRLRKRIHPVQSRMSVEERVREGHAPTSM